MNNGLEGAIIGVRRNGTLYRVIVIIINGPDHICVTRDLISALVLRKPIPTASVDIIIDDVHRSAACRQLRPSQNLPTPISKQGKPQSQSPNLNKYDKYTARAARFFHPFREAY